MKNIVICIALAGLFAGCVSGKRAGLKQPSYPIKAVFVCKQGKSIRAIFLKDSVELKLSDGRHFTLPHAISANGARYADSTETVVFWNVGNTAFMTEHDSTTYAGCVTKDSGE